MNEYKTEGRQCFGTFTLEKCERRKIVLDGAFNIKHDVKNPAADSVHNGFPVTAACRVICS